jgi:hypothetical protein
MNTAAVAPMWMAAMDKMHLDMASVEQSGASDIDGIEGPRHVAIQGAEDG